MRQKLHIRNFILILLLNINREVHTENYIAMQTADGAGGKGVDGWGLTSGCGMAYCP